MEVGEHGQEAASVPLVGNAAAVGHLSRQAHEAFHGQRGLARPGVVELKLVDEAAEELQGRLHVRVSEFVGGVPPEGTVLDPVKNATGRQEGGIAGASRAGWHVDELGAQAAGWASAPPTDTDGSNPRGHHGTTAPQNRGMTVRRYPASRASRPVQRSRQPPGYGHRGIISERSRYRVHGGQILVERQTAWGRSGAGNGG